MDNVSWLEISAAALRHNVAQLQRSAGPQAELCVMVKGNGYGHGLREAARGLVQAGVPWLEIGRAHVRTPVTATSRMPSSA